MARVEEIRKAITELPLEELEKYLSETVWAGVSGDDEEKLHQIISEAMHPFIVGYTNEETREGYTKLMKLAEIK
jgi:hypothetical protein